MVRETKKQMRFLHMLANLDAYQAWLSESDPKNQRVPSTTPTVRFASTPTIDCFRPSSVKSVQASDGHPVEFRPKSGKSLTFNLGSDRLTPVISLSSAEYTQFRREVKTPISARRVSNGRTIQSGRSTALSSIREGARSPTPNAFSDMEPAFLDLQLDRCGLNVWRVQGTKLVPLDENEHGFFQEGTVYIVLYISPTYERALHYWDNEHCTEADIKYAETKTHELDKIISTAHILSHETQRHESTVFQRLCPDGIIYIEGRHKLGISKTATYDKRMYIVSGRKYARAQCVHPQKHNLQSDAVVILDGFPRVYVWIGSKTGYILRSKGIKIARLIQRKQRAGKCHVVVIDESDGHLAEAFKRKFDDETNLFTQTTDETSDNSSFSSSSTDDQLQVVLHRVSGDRVLYDMPEAVSRPLHHRYLTKRDCYLLHRGPNKPIYMWVGSQAMEDEVNNAITRAQSFISHNEFSSTLSTCRIREDHEPVEFKQCFCDWKDKLSKDMSLTKRYSAGNIGRALFSRSDKRTIATVQECWSEDTLGDYKGTTQIWVLNNNKLEVWDHPGLFSNNKCFLILHTTLERSHYQTVIYIWLGSNSDVEDRAKIKELAVEKNAELENKAIVIRILDEKEPQHFMTAFQDWMIVYDGEENAKVENGLKMFCVRDFADSATRIQQVVPAWTNLNSSASFVILSEEHAYLWYGKYSGSTEREAAKELIGILCPSRMFNHELVTESKESASFCSLIGPKTEYEEDYKEKDLSLDRRPACLKLYDATKNVFENIDNFFQEDLTEEDVYVLDTYNQIYIWCGERIQSELRKQVFQIAKNYIDADPAGRTFDLVSLWFVSQRSEPVAFTKHFKTWNALGYSGRHAYEVLRKRIRQDNAKIDINQNMIDTSFLNQPKYNYKVLLKKELPHDVDDTRKHTHLSEKQFRLHLKISRLEFYRLPTWKQNQILKSARLLYQPILTTKPFPDVHLAL